MTTQTIENKIAGYEEKIILAFRIAKKKFFFVVYGEHGEGTQNPYFATSAAVLNYVRSDYNECGQCQERVLKGKTKAKNFYDKWDSKHCKSLTVAEMEELKIDIEVLKEKYEYIETNWFNEVVKFDREKSNKK